MAHIWTCLFTISSQRSSSRQRVPIAPTSEVTSISYTSDSNSRTTGRTPTRSAKETQSDREGRSMAQPSSSHRERDRDREHRSDRERRERSERSHHHHHRTISSTTLLLVLSLILAILAVMLSLPSSSSRSSTPPVVPPVGHPPAGHSSAGQAAEPPMPGGPGVPPMPAGTEHIFAIPEPTGIWAHLTPKRNRELINRESLVAFRESEVAKREAELLAGSPGGLTLSCPPAPASTIIDALTFTVTHTVAPVLPAPMAIETQTVVKEVIREIESTVEPPAWYHPMNPRFDDVLDREAKVAERERDIAMREDIVGRRENDASRREGWIMEQLLQLQNEPGPIPNMDEEYVYEVPPLRRKPKEVVEVAPPIISHIYETETETETIHHISTSIIHETTTSIINNVLTSVATTTKTALSIQTVVSTATLTSTFIPPVKTVTVPMPAGTRAAPPAPERPKGSPTGPRGPGRTNVVEMVTEEETFIPVEVEEETIVAAPPPPPRETLPPPPPPPPPVRETVTVMRDRDYDRERYEREDAPPPPQRVRKPRGGQERPQPTRPQGARQQQKESKGWFGRGPW
ncbi:hypothetical protein RhiJN_00576 [Ceratobasidium sp. AG-Ba]|nr:hypothetical protein RhiJN_00576 [Ceratobasidium sp. AG-Ba]QRW01601.1 hypothetical protein RhiLY_00598 [Ceratobasidium sp. AG-Ba]